ncbi:TetR/AcrR family transcriptional regulator [Rhodococcus spelaei]|uniref:TetR/AcrR family transcriptional regulator n=1 Tax=Rhodococcus spelaei TaxID=2546320 RepID=A0A541BRV3_9NOCA|nr:TetR family transcriptional regulator [Rhodococcus spelaei]TQF75067.1 TetR/AcrR family transcriptional regulator [Rhodococcus spelaei]
MAAAVSENTEPDASGGHRTAVLTVATDLFRANGFAATGVREIARQAGIDPALVIRYFGSKEKLFLRVMTMSDAFAEVMAGPLDDLGSNLVDFILSRTRAGTVATTVFAALVRASDRPMVQAHLQESIDKMIVEPLAPRLRGDDAELRSRLVSAQIGGLMVALFVEMDPALVAAPHDRIVNHYGAAVQSLING